MTHESPFSELESLGVKGVDILPILLSCKLGVSTHQFLRKGTVRTGHHGPCTIHQSTQGEEDCNDTSGAGGDYRPRPLRRHQTSPSPGGLGVGTESRSVLDVLTPNGMVFDERAHWYL